MSTTTASAPDAAVSTNPAADPIVERKKALFQAMSTALQTAGGYLRFCEPVACRVKTFWGQPMHVVLPEAVSHEIALSGVYESELTIAFISLLNPGGVVFDIGAHRGYFTMLAAELVGPTGQVHAFEPTPASFALLTRNTEHLPYVHRNNLAVYSQSTDLTFNDFGIEAPAFNSLFAPRLPAADAAKLPVQQIKVRATSIDDYVRQTGVTPGFIKIDAESAERDILEGMAETLQRYRPCFTLETGDIQGAMSTKALAQLACSFGYRPVSIKNGVFEPHALQEVYGYGNLLFVPAG